MNENSGEVVTGTATFGRIPVEAHIQEQRTKRIFVLSIVIAVVVIGVTALIVTGVEASHDASVDATREIATVAIAALLGALGGSSIRTS